MNYYLFEYWIEHGDPRNVNYPLMSGGPLPVLTIVLVYLLFVTKIGPKIMKNRKPFELKRVSIFSTRN